MTSPDHLAIILIGCGATLVMDVWLMLLKQFGVQTLNFAFMGRWFGHLFRGRIRHASIAKAEPIPNELLLGWIVHYAVGVTFAGMLVGLVGITWVHKPTWAPAMLIGIGTVAAPFLIMQPAMGSGIAGAKTPAPLKGRLRSITNHAVFGAGLYLSALVVAWIMR